LLSTGAITEDSSVSCLRRVAAFGLLAALTASSVARAEKATLVVFHATARVPAGQKTLDWLQREAQRLGAAVVDVTPNPEVESRAPVLLSGAVAAYEAQDFPRTIADLDEAITEASQNGALGLTRSQLADLFLYRALAATRLGAEDKAWADFVRAAAVDITRRLDPLRFPPRVLLSMERAFEAVRNGQRTQLSVVAPTSCSISLDGRPVLAKQATAIASGEHFVRVTCPRSKPHGAVVEVFGSAQAYAPELVPLDLTSEVYLLEARARQAQRVLLATFVDAPPTLTLRTIEVASNRAVQTAVVSASDRTAVRSALELALGNPVVHVKPDTRVVVRPTQRQWYEQPWLWGVVGAGIGAAVVLPFVFRDDSSQGRINVVPEGLP